MRTHHSRIRIDNQGIALDQPREDFESMPRGRDAGVQRSRLRIASS